MANGQISGPPAVDFYSMLSGLGDTLQANAVAKRKAQIDEARKGAFTDFTALDPSSADYGKQAMTIAQRLGQAGDQEGAVKFLGVAQTAADRARQAARDKVTDSHWSADYNLRKAANERAGEDKPLFKEVARPDGTTEIYRITRDGQATRVDTGQSTPLNPANNPKNPFTIAQAKADSERVSGYSDAAKLAEEGTGTLDQIDALRKDAFTAPIIGPLAAKIGHPATQALEASTNALALDVAQKMKGSLSDKDIAFVKSQVPTAATGGAAGEAASGMIRSGFERSKQRAQFYRTWAEQNGNINGADAAWSKYITENPITVEDKKALGGRRFNPEYNKDFSSYLPGSTGATGTPAMPKVGQLVDGYRYKGGNPADPASWVKMQ